MVFRLIRLLGLFLICAAPPSIVNAQPGVTANGVQPSRDTSTGWRAPGQQGVRLAAVREQRAVQPAVGPVVSGRVEQAGYSWPSGSGVNTPRTNTRNASVAPVGVAAPDARSCHKRVRNFTE